jgi:serine/threonine-protein kinase
VDVAPGAVLLGKYRVDEVLGVGGMGKVVRAWHLLLEQPVAIKVLLPHVADSEATVQRFVREAQATVRLRSEHIARVMDVATLYDGTPVMVMEYLEGDDLNQIVRAHGPQSPHVVVDLMLQACEGIAEAHAAGIVHRDIKPSNFFITHRPDGSQLLKILDFGISKSPVGWSELTGTQTVVGTPSYMAPEQMKAARNADPRSDVWSMGIVIYQLLAGRPPFAGESYVELALKVNTDPPAPLHVALPGGLGDVIWRCLEKDPAQRIQSVGELAKLLAPYSSDPVGGAQAADRANRILAARSSQPGGRLRSEGGSMVPAPLAPSTWQRTGNSSVSHGAGQVTYQTTGRKGWLIAGALSLIIVAGVGGWVVSEVMRGRETAAAAPAPVAATPAPVAAAPAPTPAPTPTPTPTPAPVAAAVTVDAGVPVAADAAVAVVPIDAAVAVAKPVEVAKPRPVEVVKPRPVEVAKPRPVEVAKPTPKPRPKPTNNDDLFDSRH